MKHWKKKAGALLLCLALVVSNQTSLVSLAAEVTATDETETEVSEPETTTTEVMEEEGSEAEGQAGSGAGETAAAATESVIETTEAEPAETGETETANTAESVGDASEAESESETAAEAGEEQSETDSTAELPTDSEAELTEESETETESKTEIVKAVRKKSAAVRTYDPDEMHELEAVTEEGMTVKAEIPAGAFSEEVELRAAILSVDDKAEKVASITEKLREECGDGEEPAEVIGSYVADISFLNGSGEKTQPKKDVEVTITIEDPVDVSLDADAEPGSFETAIYHIADDGTVELISGEITLDNEKKFTGMSFTSGSFSPFAAVILNTDIAAQQTKELTVDNGKDAAVVEGESYRDIQSAINYIEDQEDKEGWTITVESGTYARFTVLNGLNGLTVQAAEGATAVIKTADSSAAPATTSGAYPDTAGVSIRYANGVTLKNLTFKVGTQNKPWTSAAVSNYTESGDKGDEISVIGCNFIGSESNFGVFINTGTTAFAVQGCKFTGLKEAISMYGDGTVMKRADVTDNTFDKCSFALHGYYGGTGEAGVLTFSGNEVTGTDDTRCKIVVQDQTNTGAIKVDVKDNTLSAAIVGLVNLRETGETVSDVKSSNTFRNGSFYVEAIEPGTIEFYTCYEAPDEEGHWSLTGKENFDVDWGKNPDGSTAAIQKLVDAANASGSKTLSISGIDPDNLIKTFTWFKDGIYWVSGKGEEPGPDVPGGEYNKPEHKIDISKTAAELNENDETTVKLTVGSNEEKNKVAVLFVLDYSTSVDVRDAAAGMIEELAAKDKTDVKAAVVNYWYKADAGSWTSVTPDTRAEDLLKQPEGVGGTNYHAGLLAAKKLLNAEEIKGYTTYLVTISDGITYLWTDEDTGYTNSVWYHNRNNGPNDIQNANSVYDMKYYIKEKDGKTIISRSMPDDVFRALAEGSQDAVAKYNATKPYFEIYIHGQKYNSSMNVLDFESTEEDVAQNYLIGNEIAIYKTATLYKELADRVDNAYAFSLDENHWESYPYGRQLMNYLIEQSDAGWDMTEENAKETFDSIKNQILYTIASGTVTDVIGNDFDLQSVESFKLTVGGAEVTGVPDGNNKNRVNFGERDENGKYPYVVEYMPGEAGKEQFVWNINVPVEEAKGLELSYVLKLVNKSEKEGTYGVYDEDGSEKYESIQTNVSAVLKYTSTENDEGELVYPKPTVSYTVEEKTGITVTKLWDDADNKDGLRPESVRAVLLADGETTGRTITLNEENNWKGSFTELDKYADGKEISYTVAEAEIPEGYTCTITGDAAEGYVLTNTHAPKEENPPREDDTPEEKPGNDPGNSGDGSSYDPAPVVNTAQPAAPAPALEAEAPAAETPAAPASTGAATGDSTPVAVWLVLALAAAAALMGLAFYRKQSVHGKRKK